MSISLNNHENRIKALENIKLKRTRVVDNGTLLQNPYNFELLEIRCGDSNQVGDCTSYMISTQMLKEMGGYFSSVVVDNNIGGSIIGVECIQIKITENSITCTSPWMNITAKNGVQQITDNFWHGVVSIDGLSWGGGINLGILLKRLLVYIKTYSKLFHLQFLEVK